MYVAPSRTSSTTSSRRISATSPRNASAEPYAPTEPVRIPEVGEEAGAGERDLHDPVGSASRVRELLRGEEALATERVDHGDRRAIDLHVTQLVAPPSTPQERVDVPFRNPSTDSVSWLWNERRRISPSVRTASPAASCRRTASSTAASSMRLNAAGEISLRESRSRASMRSGGRRRLPTTSDRAITPPLYGDAR